MTYVLVVIASRNIRKFSKNNLQITSLFVSHISKILNKNASLNNVIPEFYFLDLALLLYIGYYLLAKIKETQNNGTFAAFSTSTSSQLRSMKPS